MSDPIKYWDLLPSEVYWAIWIGLGFLVPELLAHFRILPIMTLSRTAWDEEGRWPILRTILLGFLLGLCIHIVFRTSLWKTEIATVAIAFLSHALWARVP